MEEYINGCYTKYGTRPLTVLEQKFGGTLSNGMYFVCGEIPEDGVSVDVYRDNSCKDLVFMEHGIQTNMDVRHATKDVMDMMTMIAENRCHEMKL